MQEKAGKSHDTVSLKRNSSLFVVVSKNLGTQMLKEMREVNSTDSHLENV